MFWNWIRTRTREAVLAGFSDALDHVSADGAESLALAVAGLEARLRPALPAPVEVETAASGRRKKSE